MKSLIQLLLLLCLSDSQMVSDKQIWHRFRPHNWCCVLAIIKISFHSCIAETAEVTWDTVDHLLPSDVMEALSCRHSNVRCIDRSWWE